MKDTAIEKYSEEQLVRRRGDYGFAALYVPIMLGVVGVIFLTLGLFAALQHTSLLFAVFGIAYGIFMLLNTASYVYTTRRGKFLEWAKILAHLDLRGDERVLDLGCGRGMVLLMAANLLPRGRAVGIDLWNAGDQSGNAASATRHNAELEGVAERIELHTGDMQNLPFGADSFDIVLSSLAIHNIHERAGREKALSEAIRVLKPGGRIIIADFRETSRYAECLQRLGMWDVDHRMLGWRLWYGGPWTATKLASAIKPD
jgi:arsenite methyltransferase